ncbi:hypothetical protein MTO96_033196 [Rhipicephalus appendiculatus]
MADADPETLLEWLNMGQGDERDMQLIALEQLCMLLLMSDNVDRCFERRHDEALMVRRGWRADVDSKENGRSEREKPNATASRQPSVGVLGPVLSLVALRRCLGLSYGAER